MFVETLLVVTKTPNDQPTQLCFIWTTLHASGRRIHHQV